MKKLTSMLHTVLFVLHSVCYKNNKSARLIHQNSKDLKTAEGLKMDVGRNIKLNIVGMPTVHRVTNRLTISLENGFQLLSMKYTMNRTISLPFVVPTTEKNLKLKYGAIEKLVPIRNNKADFSFIPTLVQMN